MRKIGLILILVAMLLGGCVEQTQQQLYQETINQQVIRIAELENDLELAESSCEKLYARILVLEAEATYVSEIEETASKEPVLSDYSLDLIVVEKRCFGSAGCIITVIPELIYITPVKPKLIEGEVFILIYEIYGGKDGTLTFNLTIAGDEIWYDAERIHTASSTDVLTVKAVSFLKN